jgi:hypothetical protein
VAKCCLLITEQFEPTADWLIEELRARSVACVRWNLDRFPIGSTLTYGFSNDQSKTTINVDDREIDVDEIATIWCRGFRPSGLPDGLKPADHSFVQSECQRALDALLTVSNAVWVNHPQRHARANAKPAQLHIARHVGLDIPPTIITNDPKQANDFVSTSQDATVYKAMSQALALDPGKALFTGLVTAREADSLDLIRISPGIFQRLVPKAYEIRATVVGSRIFSGRIDSQANDDTRIDWRHRPYDVDSQPVDLPPHVCDGVLKMMEHFGLVYGAFDFIVTPDGRYVFLEVNPAGQYMWVETVTHLPITAALADALMPRE